jgi:hypothetical protein
MGAHEQALDAVTKRKAKHFFRKAEVPFPSTPVGGTSDDDLLFAATAAAFELDF